MAQFNCKNWREAKEYALRYPELIRIIMIQNKSLLEYDPMHSIELSATPSKEEIIPIIERIEGKYFPPSILTRSNELYEKELTNPQWINKSNEIKARDFHICQRCYNSIVLNDISELQKYLNCNTDFEFINTCFQNRFNVKGRNCNSQIILQGYIPKLKLYSYTLNSFSKYLWEENNKVIFFSEREIESSTEINWNYGTFFDEKNRVTGYQHKCDYTLLWQYCELGNTNNQLILSHCGNDAGDYYKEDKTNKRHGILTYNQYSIIFPLYSLNTRPQLEVHHKHYRKKDGIYKKPWEYSNDELMVLCHECHQEVHKEPIPIIYE